MAKFETEMEPTAIRPKRAEPESRQPYVDVDKLQSSDHLVAIISQRRSNGTFTFAIFKEFERDGRIERTGFIPEELGDSYKRMVTMACDRIRKIRESGSTPFPMKQP